MRKNKIIGVSTLVLVLIFLLVPFAFADEEEVSHKLKSPFTDYGAETYSALNLFKAVFPDTTPGEEEWYLNINWGADPKRGYLSMPLSLPGHGKYTSARLDTFMQRAQIPIKGGQYTLYNIGKPVWMVPKGYEGRGSYTTREPFDDYTGVLANVPQSEIADLAERGTWQINPRLDIPDWGPSLSPGWLTEYSFLPPDLQVKDLKTTIGATATATATFYNSCNIGGTTDVYLYKVMNDGSKELIKKQEVYIGPFKTATLQADYTVTPNTKGVAASIARPWTGTEWGYGYFKAENDLYQLEGYAVETGNGGYPVELQNILKSKWENNIKETEASAGVDLQVTATPGMNPYPLSWNRDTMNVNVRVNVKDKISGQMFLPIELTMSGPGGTRVENTKMLGGFASDQYTFKAGPGTYKVTAKAFPVPSSLEINPNDNYASCTVRVVKGKAPKVTKEEDIHGELGGGGGTGENEKWDEDDE